MEKIRIVGIGMKVLIVNVKILDRLVSEIDGLIFIRVLFMRFFKGNFCGCFLTV